MEDKQNDFKKWSSALYWHLEFHWIQREKCYGLHFYSQINSSLFWSLAGMDATTWRGAEGYSKASRFFFPFLILSPPFLFSLCTFSALISSHFRWNLFTVRLPLLVGITEDKEVSSVCMELESRQEISTWQGIKLFVKALGWEQIFIE